MSSRKGKAGSRMGRSGCPKTRSIVPVAFRPDPRAVYPGPGGGDPANTLVWIEPGVRIQTDLTVYETLKLSDMQAATAERIAERIMEQAKKSPSPILRETSREGWIEMVNKRLEELEDREMVRRDIYQPEIWMTIDAFNRTYPPIKPNE